MPINQLFLYNLSNLGSYSGGTVRDLFDNGSTGEGSAAIGETISFTGKAGQIISVTDTDGTFDQTDFDQDTSGSHVLEGWTSGTNIGTYSVPSGESIDVEYGYELTPVGGGDTVWVYAVATNYPSVLDTNGFASTGPIDPSKTYTITAFDTEPNPAYSTLFTCYGHGTRILTDTGYQVVEALAVGDLVWTLDRGLAPLRWIGSRTLHFDAHNAAQRPVEIKPNALGPGAPQRSLIVSPQHRILLRAQRARSLFDESEVLSQANGLLGLSGVRTMKGRRSETYYSLLLDHHAILSAEGALSESFYPGPVALRIVGPQMRGEIERIFPGVHKDPEFHYGPKARRTLSRRDTERLVSALRRPGAAGACAERLMGALA